MKVLRNIDVLKKAIKNISNIGFIPTMGGLHKGHISLIKQSQKKCRQTLVSIYVNPKQFNNKNDFSIYPRNLNKDLNLLKRLKVDHVFIPNTKEIYMIKRKKKITLLESQKILCAKYRVGHFEGVLDIMDRFIKLIKPTYVFMGEKDFQQLFLVKNFTKNKYESKIFSCKTVRDKNKVALSSRNNLLSKTNLNKAGLIAKYLQKIKAKVLKGYINDDYFSVLKKELTNKYKIKIEYLEIRNEKNLQIVTTNNKFRLFISYYIDGIRLIDNF
jgi:pantoate--beta-alanine ligase